MLVILREKPCKSVCPLLAGQPTSPTHITNPSHSTGLWKVCHCSSKLTNHIDILPCDILVLSWAAFNILKMFIYSLCSRMAHLFKRWWQHNGKITRSMRAEQREDLRLCAGHNCLWQYCRYYNIINGQTTAILQILKYCTFLKQQWFDHLFYFIVWTDHKVICAALIYSDLFNSRNIKPINSPTILYSGSGKMGHWISCQGGLVHPTTWGNKLLNCLSKQLACDVCPRKVYSLSFNWFPVVTFCIDQMHVLNKAWTDLNWIELNLLTLGPI